jgi:hypothetical protein
MSGVRGRTNWTDEQRDALRDAYAAGRTYQEITAITGLSQTSVTVGIDQFKLVRTHGQRRKEAIVRRLWPERPPGRIAQAFRFDVMDVRRIAERLGLGPEASGAIEAERRRGGKPWDDATVKWADAHRTTNLEARIIAGEMDRRYPRRNAA